MKVMGLNRVVNDIETNQYSYEEIFCITERIHEENNENAEFCVFKAILLRKYNIPIHRYLISSTLKMFMYSSHHLDWLNRRKTQWIFHQIHPEGVECRRLSNTKCS